LRYISRHFHALHSHLSYNSKHVHFFHSSLGYILWQFVLYSYQSPILDGAFTFYSNHWRTWNGAFTLYSLNQGVVIDLSSKCDGMFNSNHWRIFHGGFMCYRGQLHMFQGTFTLCPNHWCNFAARSSYAVNTDIISQHVHLMR
jgi:hypothetical protein